MCQAGHSPPSPSGTPTPICGNTANLGAIGAGKFFLAFGEKVGKLVPPNVFIHKMLQFEWWVQIFHPRPHHLGLG